MNTDKDLPDANEVEKRLPLRDRFAAAAQLLRMKLSPSPGIPANVLAVAAADLCMLSLNNDDHLEKGRYWHTAKMSTVVAVSLGEHRHQADRKLPRPSDLHLPSLTIKPGSKTPGIEAVREARRWLIEHGIVTMTKMDDNRCWKITYDLGKLYDLPDVFRPGDKDVTDTRPRCQRDGCTKLIHGVRTTKAYCSRKCQQAAYRARCDGKSEVAQIGQRDGKSEVTVTVNPMPCDGKSPTNRGTNVPPITEPASLILNRLRPTALCAEWRIAQSEDEVGAEDDVAQLGDPSPVPIASQRAAKRRTVRRKPSSQPMMAQPADSRPDPEQETEMDQADAVLETRRRRDECDQLLKDLASLRGVAADVIEDELHDAGKRKPSEKNRWLKKEISNLLDYRALVDDQEEDLASAN